MAVKDLKALNKRIDDLEARLNELIEQYTQDKEQIILTGKPFSLIRQEQEDQQLYDQYILHIVALLFSFDNFQADEM